MPVAARNVAAIATVTGIVNNLQQPQPSGSCAFEVKPGFRHRPSPQSPAGAGCEAATGDLLRRFKAET